MSDEYKVIKGTINCSRINKARLFTIEGKEGKYLKIVLIRKRQLDKFGRVAYMLKEDVSQQDQQNGIEGGFIGDAYVQKPKSAPAPAIADQQPKPTGKLPF